MKKLRVVALILCLTAVLTMCLGIGFAANEENTLILPESLTVVGARAFAGTNANSVVIPGGVTEIGDYAFAASSRLSDVYLRCESCEISETAFDNADELTFHVYFGSDCAVWAQHHGYTVKYISDESTGEDGDSLSRALSAINSKAPAITAAAPEFEYSRIILRLKNGMSLPDLKKWQPEDVIPFDGGLYLIQLSTPEEAQACANALKSWGGCVYVEPDFMIASTDIAPSSSAALPNSIGETDDVMGFTDYAAYLEANYSALGNVTIAVIDTGVNSFTGANISSASYDFISGRYRSGGDSAMNGGHGTRVARTIYKCFGSLSDHLTIIAYKVCNGSDSNEFDYFFLGQAIEMAFTEGHADFVNISLAGRTYEKQESEYLREVINRFGADRIICAAGNHGGVPVSKILPARYATSVAAVEAHTNGCDFVFNSISCSGANYGGFTGFLGGGDFENTTSFAAPMLAAAKALVSLDPNPEHYWGKYTFTVLGDNQQPTNTKIPDLKSFAVIDVTDIVLCDGEPIEEVLEPDDRLSIDYEVIPSNATVKTVTVTTSDANVIKIVSKSESRVRVQAVNDGSAVLTFASDDGKVVKQITLYVVNYDVYVIIGNKPNPSIIMKDEIWQLTATVGPESATNKEVIWSSSNPSIATVSNNGLVTQVGSGEVTITATAAINSERYDSITLQVLNHKRVDHVEITSTSGTHTLSIQEDYGAMLLSATVYPQGALQDVTWETTDASVATVSQSGLVTAVSAGKVFIVARSVSDHSKTDRYEIDVVQWPVSLTISGLDVVRKGEWLQLTATLSPENVSDDTILWSSSDTTIATVSESGVVAGIKPGSVRITAESQADRRIYDTKWINVVTPIYTVSLNLNGGTYSGATSFTRVIGSEIGTLPEPARVDYDFIGWYTQDGMKIEATYIHETEESLDLYACWLGHMYSITCFSNYNGGETWTNSVRAGNPIGYLPTVTRNYYTFDGWYTAASGGEKITSEYIQENASPLTLYAHWIGPVQYKVMYNANGGTCSIVSRIYDVGKPIGTLPLAERAYYTFAGWYTAPNEGTEITSSYSQSALEEVTFYAHWSPCAYTISWQDVANCAITVNRTSSPNANAAIGTLSNGATVYYGDLLSIVYVPAQGFRITTKGVESITVNSNIGASAVYVTVEAVSYTYTILYRSANGTELGSDTATYVYGTTNTIAAPAVSGYTAPESQSVVWDSEEKVIIFVYEPEAVGFTTKTGTISSSPKMTYSARIEYQNRTANSIQIRVVWSTTIKAGWYIVYGQRFKGNCDNMSIPVTTVAAFDTWKNVSSSDRTKTGTSSWITVPLATTNKTSVSVYVYYYQVNSNNTDMTANYNEAGVKATWSITVPAY